MELDMAQMTPCPNGVSKIQQDKGAEDSDSGEHSASNVENNYI